jgi:putative transcriptional regulator
MSKGEVADNIGVSRKMIYNYEEENACATFETALRLEEFMDEPIVKPLHILNIPGAISDDKPRFASELEREILSRLSDIGFQVYPVKKAPFNAFTVEEDKVMLANIPREKLEVLLKRARILKSISNTIKTAAFFVIDSSGAKGSLEGVPIVHKVELDEMEESGELFERLEERVGGNRPKFKVI